MHIKVQQDRQKEASQGENADTDMPAELDTDSLPPISSDEPSDLPWLPDTDDARWVDFEAIDQGEQWGSGPEVTQANDFNPASAFEKTSSVDNDSRMESKSQAGPEHQIWEDDISGSETKRQRLSNNTYRRTSEQSFASPVNGRSSEHFDRLNSDSRTDILDGQDGEDDDHSSGEFQNQSFDDSADRDVIRALGMENVRRLASMTDGELADFEDSSSVDSQVADDGQSQSSSDISSEDMPSFRFCTNCTSDMDPGQSHCMECGHDQNLDTQIFSQLERQIPGASAASSDTLLFYDEVMLEHEEGKRMPHPERPDRIRAIIARLMSTGLAGQCKRLPCREASRAELAACHTKLHIDSVAAKAVLAQASGEEIGVPRVYFSSDTYVRPSTFKCASLSAGGAVEAACAVVRGECKNAAAIIRPPGHHAESNMAMGFCFFNNAAVAARAAQAAGAEKVLIMDWDVHHGNGTQHIFEHDPSVLYMSIHRWDGGHFFPGTGGPSEIGKGPGAGRTVNIPWPMGNMGNGDYMAAFHHVVLPIAYEFSPDLIIISAGFDAAAGDPLGGCQVTSQGFAHMTAMLTAIAPSVALLEGGYNLQATADGTEAMLRVLLGEQPPYLPSAGKLNPLTSCTLQTVLRKQAPYWACLRSFQDQSSIDPYRSPFFAASSAGLPLSPRSRAPTFAPFSSPRKQDSDLIARQNSIGGLENSQSQLRSKLNAIRSQGKSQRKLALMHALHLMAVKHKLRASNEVTKKLTKMPRPSRPHFKNTENGKVVTSPQKMATLATADSHGNGQPLEDDPFATQDSDSNERAVPKLQQVPMDLVV